MRGRHCTGSPRTRAEEAEGECWRGALQGAAGLSLLSVRKGQQGREDSECAHGYVVTGDQAVYSLHISAAVCDVTSGRDTGGT